MQGFDLLVFVTDCYLTSLRWLIGVIFGVIFAVALAAIDHFITNFKRSKNIFRGILNFCRAIPILALVPLIQLFGVEEGWKVGLIGWSVAFPIWIAIIQAHSKKLIDVELSLLASGMSRPQIVKNYNFPKAISGLLVGVEISIGVGWLSVVASEAIGTYTRGFWAGGLGYRLMKFHDSNHWQGMIFYLITFGLLGILSTIGWRRIFRSRTRINTKWGYEDEY